MNFHRTLPVITGFICTSLLCAASLSLAQMPRWSTDERQAVEAGELATRSAEERRGELNLIGGSSWQRINAPPARAWAAARDISRYQHMLPLLGSARIIAGSGDDIRVLMRHRQGPVNIQYHLRMRFNDDTRTMRFQLDESRTNDIQAAWGYVHVTPWPGGGTLFSWGVMADFGSGLFSGLMRPLVSRWMLRIPTTFKRYIEGWGQRNYASR